MNQVAYLRTNTNSVAGAGFGVHGFNSAAEAVKELRERGFVYRSMWLQGGGETELWVKEVAQTKAAHLCSCCWSDSVAECDAEGCGVLRMNGYADEVVAEEVAVEVEHNEETCEDMFCEICIAKFNAHAEEFNKVHCFCGALKYDGYDKCREHMGFTCQHPGCGRDANGGRCYKHQPKANSYVSLARGTREGYNYYIKG